MSDQEKHDVLVIGTGIIGVMSALYLQSQGRSVTLLERGKIARGASSGNAGILAFPEIIPIPAPGLMKKARLLWPTRDRIPTGRSSLLCTSIIHCHQATRSLVA